MTRFGIIPTKFDITDRLSRTGGGGPGLPCIGKPKAK